MDHCDSIQSVQRPLNPLKGTLTAVYLAPFRGFGGKNRAGKELINKYNF